MIIDSVCSRCDVKYGREDRPKGVYKRRKLCPECKWISNKKKGDRFRILARDLELRDRSRRRMTENNPMRRDDVAQKMSETSRKRILSGEITFKKGSEHHSWRGNRRFDKACRLQLKKVWVKSIYERDEFRCVYCKREGNLQVHHLEPLRNFIKKAMDFFKVDNVKNLCKNKMWEMISYVVSLHKLEDGVTVCHFCHKKIDSQYRRTNAPS